MRLFVAVKLQKNEAAVANLLRELACRPAPIRWVRPEGAHLTLKFLGEVKEQNLSSVKLGIASCCQAHGPFLLGLGGFGVFPNPILKDGSASPPESPRVFFVEVVRGTDALSALARDLEEKFLEIGFEKEKRDFHPHLTLGRARLGISASFGQTFLRRSPPSWEAERIDKVSLMKSELSREGARYQTLAEFPLHQ